MMNEKRKVNNEKIKFLNLQLIATIGFIVALLISFFLTLDKKLSLEGKKRIFTEKEAQNLALFQTILVFIISSCFLYINYKQYNLAKRIKSTDQEDLLLQTKTSILAIISAVVGLYIIFKNYNVKNLTISETELF